MPAFLHAALKHAGQKKGLKGPALDRYVYGTLTNIDKQKNDKEAPLAHVAAMSAAAKIPRR